MYPSRVPDLLFESPLIIFGRYCGKFPSSPKIEGILSDTSNFSIDLKLQEAMDIPISEVHCQICVRIIEVMYLNHEPSLQKFHDLLYVHCKGYPALSGTKFTIKGSPVYSLLLK